MEIYLAIITTVLVLTQIIRVTQNHIQLRRQQEQFEENLFALAKCEPTAEDFQTQRETMKMLHDWLLKQKRLQLCIDEDVEGGI